MKILMLNSDIRPTGIESLGKKEKIAKIFGVEPIDIPNWDVLLQVTKAIGDTKIVNKKVKVGAIDVVTPTPEYRFFIGFEGLNAIVIDTIDSPFWFMKEKYLGSNPEANMNIWDKLSNQTMKWMSNFGRIPAIGIVLCHQKTSNDNISAFLQGSFKDQIGSVFDIILFTKVYKTKAGSRFVWQVLADTLRATRTTPKLQEYMDSINESEINQDFDVLLSNCGIDNPKVLIIGEYGSGKTHSLRTLVNYFNK